MHLPAKETLSFWETKQPSLRFAKLAQDMSADVVVVGAGITGVTTAYLLATAGKKVILVDSNVIGRGDTSRTSAHLTMMLDHGYSHILQTHGKETTQLVLQSQIESIDFMEALIKKEEIHCHFERLDGCVFLGKEGNVEILEKELQTLEQLGITDAKIVQDLKKVFPEGPTLTIPDQARFEPLKYIYGLLKAFVRAGGEVFTETQINKMDGHCVEAADGHKISAEHIVVATYSPIEGTFVFLKQAAYRSYVVGAAIPKNSVPDALYWDTSDPYHYVRIAEFNSKEDLLIVGGEDHKTGQAAEENSGQPFETLQNWAREYFPNLIRDFKYFWSGQILEPVDGLAFIGRIPYRGRKIYMATGYSGNGLTYGTIAGMLLSDLILEKKNPWEKIYDPTRKNLLSVKEFLGENINAVKKMAEDWLGPGDIDSVDALAPGEGAVLRQGLTKTAVYRDNHGEIHGHSAVCTHLGCMVKWNHVEKTFDCPCHGSRFSPTTGEPLNGPAVENLKPVDLPVPSQQKSA